MIDDNEINIFDNELDRIYDVIDILESVEIKYNIFTDLAEQLRDNENIETNFYYQMMSAGFWEFREFIHNSKTFLNNPISNNDAIHHLNKISSVSYLLSINNIDINNKIDNIRSELNNRLEIIKNSVSKLNENMNEIIDEVQNYQNTSEQNEYILDLVNKIKIDSEEIVKNLPLIYFNSIISSRDLTYLYKSLNCK
jgi:hypothetical protein